MADVDTSRRAVEREVRTVRGMKLPQGFKQLSDLCAMALALLDEKEEVKRQRDELLEAAEEQASRIRHLEDQLEAFVRRAQKGGDDG